MPARDDLSRIAAHLREAGKEGRGLRRSLQKALNEAAEPIAEKIASLEHLKPYLPDRYAAILSEDLGVSTKASFSGDPKVRLVARAREKKRKIALLDRGILNHPVFARGPRRRPRSPELLEKLARETGIPAAAIKGWTWKNNQTGGMRPGFFSDVVDDAGPEVTARVMKALTETAGKITA